MKLKSLFFIITLILSSGALISAYDSNTVEFKGQLFRRIEGPTQQQVQQILEGAIRVTKLDRGYVLVNAHEWLLIVKNYEFLFLEALVTQFPSKVKLYKREPQIGKSEALNQFLKASVKLPAEDRYVVVNQDTVKLDGKVYKCIRNTSKKWEILGREAFREVKGLGFKLLQNPKHIWIFDSTKRNSFNVEVFEIQQ